MKHWGLFALLLVASCLQAFSLRPVLERWPVMEIEGGRITDVGEIWIGDTLRHSITIKNTGDEPLIVYKVEKSCNCTSVKLSNMTAAPGGVITADVTVDTAHKAGQVAITFVLYANTEQEEHVFKIMMNCVPRQKQYFGQTVSAGFLKKVGAWLRKLSTAPVITSHPVS